MASGTCRLISKYCSSIGVSLGRDIGGGIIGSGVRSRELGPLTRHPPQPHGLPVAGAQLDDDGFLKGRMRHRVEEDDPARLRTDFPARRVGDVDHLVAPEFSAARLDDPGGNLPRFVVQDAVAAARRILSAGEGEEKDRADRNPQRVDKGIASFHRLCSALASPLHGYHTGPMNRTELEKRLVDIVRKEKDIPEEKLVPETLLADAGIDSLDALTILF